MIKLTQIIRLTNQAIEKALTATYSSQAPQKKTLPALGSTFPSYTPMMVQVKPRAYAKIERKKNPV